MQSLRVWNYGAAAVHLGAAVAAAALLKPKQAAQRTVQTTRLAFDEQLQKSRVDIPVKLENSASHERNRNYKTNETKICKLFHV
jgi:hypothetical protein